MMNQHLIYSIYSQIWFIYNSCCPIVLKICRFILKIYNYNLNSLPDPTKLEADKVLDVLFHVRFADCNGVLITFPINI
jgi:hypothetical protein